MKPDKTKYRHSPLILATVLYFLLGAEQSCLAAGDTIKLAENGQPRASILIPASAAVGANQNPATGAQKNPATWKESFSSFQGVVLWPG